MLFCRLFIFFRNTIRLSNSSDPDQAQLFIWSDFGPNSLQRLSADNTNKERLGFLKGEFAFTVTVPVNSNIASFKKQCRF